MTGIRLLEQTLLDNLPSGQIVQSLISLAHL
jgi:hypothetical protein